MNRVDAKDLIFDYVTTAWTSACNALSLTPTAIRFSDDGLDEPAKGTYWMRASTQVVDEDQETLRNGMFERRFMTVGLVFCQIFAPRSDDNAARNADKLAESMRNALRNPCVDDNLEFTRAAINDTVAKEPSWVPINVSARFWYRQFL